MKKVRGSGITGVPDRGVVLVLEKSANVYVLVNLDIFVHVPALVTYYLYQLMRGNGTCLCLHFMSPICTCC